MTLPRQSPVRPACAAFEPLEPRLLLSAAPVLDDPIGPIGVNEDAPQTEIALINHFHDPDITGSVYQFVTAMGPINVHFFNAATPITVANFRAYADAWDYDYSFIHRSVSTATAGVDVIQGGGFRVGVTSIEEIVSRGEIVNEPGISNVRGTIAMARLGGQPDSATSQWYFNVEDNLALDSIDGGFAVFGAVIGGGMTVVDAIAALTVWDASGINPALTDLPLIGYTSGPLQVQHLVMIQTIGEILPLGFQVTGNTNPALVTASITPDGGLTLDYAHDAFGQANITVRATDLDGDSVDTTFTVTVNGQPDAPTLTAVAPLAGATENHDFTITYQMLADAANEADADGDAVSFRVEGVTAGTLKKGGGAVTPGATLLGPGESLVWSPPADTVGTTGAFTVVAWDGTAASAAPVQVRVAVQALPDLAATIDGSKLPAALLPGNAKLGVIKQVPILVNNLGDRNAEGVITVDLYASDDQALGPGDTKLARMQVAVKLVPGKGKKYAFKKVVAQALAPAVRYLIVQVDATGLIAELDEGNNIAVSNAAIAWQQPHIDLTGVIDTAKAPAWVVFGDPKLGIIKSVPVIVTNGGNVPAVGMITIDLYASADTTLETGGDTKLGTIRVSVKLAPGRAKGYKIANIVVPDLPAGQYHLLADLDVLGDFAESNELNNVAAGAGTVEWRN